MEGLGRFCKYEELFWRRGGRGKCWTGESRPELCRHEWRHGTSGDARHAKPKPVETGCNKEFGRGLAKRPSKDRPRAGLSPIRRVPPRCFLLADGGSGTGIMRWPSFAPSGLLALNFTQGSASLHPGLRSCAASRLPCADDPLWENLFPLPNLFRRKRRSESESATRQAMPRSQSSASKKPVSLQSKVDPRRQRPPPQPTARKAQAAFES